MSAEISSLDSTAKMYNPMDLSGKRILVTGASSGIGRACAVDLAELGAECVLIGRNEARLTETQQMLAGSGHMVLPFDLSRIEEIAVLPGLIRARDRKLSGLVHSAGICPVIPLAATSPKVLQDTMQLNLGAFVELCRQFTKRFFFTDGGSLLALSSVSSMIGWPGGSAYCSTKAALNGFIRVLALELAGKKIRANTVCPSYVKTAMMDSTGSEADRTTTDCAAAQPLGICAPEDVAHVVAFLMSDASRFITGTSLVVDGGYLAKGN